MEGRIIDGAVAKAFVEGPSMAEVQRAVCDLQASDWIPRLMDLINYPIPQLYSSGESRVCGVFRLMTESILRMVISIATDKAVWNAIMANKEVSSIRNSFSRFLSAGKENEKANWKGKANGNEKANGKERDMGMLIIEWVLGIGKDILCDFIARFNSFLDTFLFTNNKQQQQHASSSSEELNLTLRFTYFLSGVVFLLVGVTRAMGL